jgi:uncharacterized membrane protein
MSITDQSVSAVKAGASPAVRSITPSDLKDVLVNGLNDFWAMPTHVIFIGLVYTVAGLVIGRLTFGYEVLPILYPLTAGFALLGPVAAIGLYELSRRRELGLETTWTDAFQITKAPSRGAILQLGLLLLVIFFIWITVADVLFTQAFGDMKPKSFGALVEEILMTENGQWLFMIGNSVGLIFAAAVLVMSAVSFPLLLDRKASAGEAIAISVRAFMKNPFTMMLWGLAVAFALFLGSLPLFAGLAIVVPVLGHATWHLYRKLVEPVE